MMDEAYLPVADILRKMLAFPVEIVDAEAGVRSRVYQCQIEMPVELSIFRDDAGALRIGSTPPLYYVDTTLRPSYHRVGFTARLEETRDGE